MILSSQRRHDLLLVTALGWLAASNALAEAVFDGSVGPTGTLTGDMVVKEEHGTRVDTNLFHSFSILNVNPGESLTFTSDFAGITDNVISRVTGSFASLIDGPIFSEIPGAALWLIWEILGAAALVLTVVAWAIDFLASAAGTRYMDATPRAV